MEFENLKEEFWWLPSNKVTIMKQISDKVQSFLFLQFHIRTKVLDKFDFMLKRGLKLKKNFKIRPVSVRLSYDNIFVPKSIVERGQYC